jgi:hypothetical protein
MPPVNTTALSRTAVSRSDNPMPAAMMAGRTTIVA